MTAEGDKARRNRPVDIEDVDDIIGIASELKEVDDNTCRLTLMLFDLPDRISLSNEPVDE